MQLRRRDEGGLKLMPENDGSDDKTDVARCE